MDIIDFHSHIFPDSLAERAIAKLCSHSPETHAFTNGTARGLLESMNKNHITKAVLLPVATKPSQVPVINHDCLTTKTDQLIPFGALHPLTENFQEEIDFLVDNKIKGIKFHPEYQDFYMDSKQMFPMYEALSATGLIVSFHTGKDPGPFTCDHSLPQAIKNVHTNFPNLTIVAAHLGGWKVWDDVEKTLCGLPVYFDTSATPGLISDEAFERIVTRHGADRILFGTDSPWFDQGKTVEWIDQKHLSSKEKEAIFSGNAKRLLDIA